MEWLLFIGFLAYIVSQVNKAAKKRHAEEEQRRRGVNTPTKADADTPDLPRSTPVPTAVNDDNLRKQAELKARLQEQFIEKAEPMQHRLETPTGARIEHRLDTELKGTLDMTATDDAHEWAHHPASSNAQRVESWASGGSLGDIYSGEGCDTPLSTRPISKNSKRPARRQQSQYIPRTREDFIRGVVFSEAVMKRRGRV